VNAKILTCLVSIKCAEVVDPRFVKCWEYADGRFLVIPLEDYPLLDTKGALEMMLAAPADWLRAASRDEYDLVCNRIIDLDKFDELPWTALPL
jgi:hypothetical protein